MKEIISISTIIWMLIVKVPISFSGISINALSLVYVEEILFGLRKLQTWGGRFVLKAAGQTPFCY